MDGFMGEESQKGGSGVKARWRRLSGPLKRGYSRSVLVLELNVKKIKSKTLLITGAASGIGAATARLAAERGHRVILADINVEGARAVAEAIGENAVAAGLDITSEAQWDRVLDEAWARFGGLDVLVNNAAIVHAGRAENVSIAQHQRTLDVNFMGPARGMLKALPRFKKQGSCYLVSVLWI